MSKLRILVADRHPSTRSALRMLLRQQPDLDLAGEAADMAEVLGQIKVHNPDIVILHWEIVGQRLEMLLDLLELFEHPPAIVGLSVHEEDESTAKAAGLAGFTYKGAPPARLLEVIDEVSQSERQS